MGVEVTNAAAEGDGRAPSEAVFAGYDLAELEWQYSPVVWEAGVLETLDSWAERGRAYRDGRDVLVDLRYGTGEKALLDLYLPKPGAEKRPLAIFLHGGYWQMMDKADHGHFVAGIVEAGYPVAVLNYDLCPAVRIADIAGQIDEARVWLHANADRFGYLDRASVVIGHSAGAHLGALMCARGRGSAEEAFLGGFLGISGVYDLTPYLMLPVAQTLGITGPRGFRGLNPAHLEPPRELCAVLALGALESAEFHEQSQGLAQRWASAHVEIAVEEVPGVAHFAVMEHLADGVLLEAALRLLDPSSRQARPPIT